MLPRISVLLIAQINSHGINQKIGRLLYYLVVFASFVLNSLKGTCTMNGLRIFWWCLVNSSSFAMTMKRNWFLFMELLEPFMKFKSKLIYYSVLCIILGCEKRNCECLLISFYVVPIDADCGFHKASLLETLFLKTNCCLFLYYSYCYDMVIKF